MYCTRYYTSSIDDLSVYRFYTNILPFLCKELELGMVPHVHNLSTLGGRRRISSNPACLHIQFEASLVLRPVSKHNQTSGGNSGVLAQVVVEIW